ncbi:hypothetical protein [Burkholderia sp. NLJ2]
MKNGLIGESRSGHLLFGASGCRSRFDTGCSATTYGIEICGQKIELV